MSTPESASRAATDPSTLTAEDLAAIDVLVDEIRDDAGYGGQCGFVCEVLYDRHGWLNIGGVYCSPMGEPVGDHVWSMHEPTGTIIDPTADQFGEGIEVRVLAPTHPLYGRYRIIESEEDWDRLLDRARDLSAARGDWWWLEGGAEAPGARAYRDRLMALGIFGD